MIVLRSPILINMNQLKRFEPSMRKETKVHRFVNTRVTRASCNHIRETILYKRLEEV